MWSKGENNDSKSHCDDEDEDNDGADDYDDDEDDSHLTSLYYEFWMIWLNGWMNKKISCCSWCRPKKHCLFVDLCNLKLQNHRHYSANFEMEKMLVWLFW